MGRDLGARRTRAHDEESPAGSLRGRRLTPNGATTGRSNPCRAWARPGHAVSAAPANPAHPGCRRPSVWQRPPHGEAPTAHVRRLPARAAWALRVLRLPRGIDAVQEVVHRNVVYVNWLWHGFPLPLSNCLHAVRRKVTLLHGYFPGLRVRHGVELVELVDM